MTRTAEEVADWLGYLTRGELAAIKTLARALPPNPLIINIGAGGGTVTLGILEERKDVLLFSIDLNTDNKEVDTSEHLRLQEAGIFDTGHVIRVWGDSKIVGKRWRWPADLIVVDGDHTAAGLQGDIDIWRPWCKAGGIMVFHDYTRKFWPDVKPTIDRAFQGIQPILFVDTLIAFQVGETLPERVCCGQCGCNERMPSC